MRKRRAVGALAWLLAGVWPLVGAVAKDDIEFVAEHLPEVAMDNRYATLPVWGGEPVAGADRSGYEFQWAFASTTSSELEIRGPLLSLGARLRFGDPWQLGVFAFYDPLELHADRESRDLQTLFAPSTPIARPVAAEFSHLSGTANDFGFGFYAARSVQEGVLGAHRWLGGMLWQRVELKDYRFDYRILSGPQAGAAGQIDFDARYQHVVPFIGVGFPRSHGAWATDAHVLFTYPIPRRGVVGHISGPGFDIHGDTEDVGEGRHFGDPALSLGYRVTYEPAHLAFDVGSFISQAVLEPRVHRGIERNVLLSFSYLF